MIYECGSIAIYPIRYRKKVVPKKRRSKYLDKRFLDGAIFVAENLFFCQTVGLYLSLLGDNTIVYLKPQFL